MQPRDHLAVGVEPGFEMLRRHGMKVVVVQVLAGPCDLDRLAAPSPWRPSRPWTTKSALDFWPKPPLSSATLTVTLSLEARAGVEPTYSDLQSGA